WWLRQRLPIEPLFEDRFNTFIGTGPERERPLTGGFEALGTIAFAQPHDPETGPEPLLGMRPGGQNGFDHLGRRRATGRRPVDQALGCPCRILLVRTRHMGSHRTNQWC